MADTQNPYQDLPETAFWKRGVAENAAFDIRGLWQPKFHFRPGHKVATAGSCFAQHIGRALAARGYHWFDAEPAPHGLNEDSARRFNYGIFSFRTGNIYTARALLQWVSWALEMEEPPTELWQKQGRFYDPFRPAIEPGGFESADELIASRKATLAAIRRAINECKYFVFTLGLTESWRHADLGHEYAMCPGTLAGDFDAENHEFHNHKYENIRSDLIAALRLMRSENPKLQMLLTVSPVPLTATASGHHVLTATSHSKSTLRAVAGFLAAEHSHFDYFPSYEIITTPPYRGMFFEPNLRGVNPNGVALVMENFFYDQARVFGAPVDKTRTPKRALKAASDVVCEEEMLDAFAR